MTKVYENLEQKPYHSHYRYFEVDIDATPEKVWPHAIRIGDWMSDHRLETIAGEHGTVGNFERVFPRGKAAEGDSPNYHLYGIADIVPYKYIGLEVFPERGGSYGSTKEWIGFDSILLVDTGRATKVIVLLLVLDVTKAEKEVSSQVELEQEDQATREQLGRYFENLRSLVKGRG